jgi:hypothetical protein
MSIRQRRAEVATGSATSFAPELLELECSQHLEEPIPESPRFLIGPLIVLTRKLFASFFLKWYMHPLMQQQNSFNSAAALRIRELTEDNRKLQLELRELRRLLKSRSRDGEGDA